MEIKECIEEVVDFVLSNLNNDKQIIEKAIMVKDWLNSPFCPLVDSEEVFDDE